MTIPLLPRVSLPDTDDLEVCVIGDLHIGAPDHAKDRWQADKAYILSQDPQRLRVLTVGDLVQCDTKLQKHAGVYQQTKDLDGQIEEAVAELGQIADYIDLVIEGNHDLRAYAQVGISPGKQIAAQLGLSSRYVRDSALVAYEVGRAKRSRARDGAARSTLYHIFCYHGDKASSARTSLERAGNMVLADAYACGHTHDPQVFTDRYYAPYPQTESVTVRERVYLVTGGYQRGEGYALRANLRPRRLGCARFILHGDERLVEACV